MSLEVVRMWFFFRLCAFASREAYLSHIVVVITVIVVVMDRIPLPNPKAQHSSMDGRAASTLISAHVFVCEIQSTTCATLLSWGVGQ